MKHLGTTDDPDDIVKQSQLGTAASKNVGTSPGNVVELDSGGKLPPLDGSQLTNLPGGGGPLSSADIADATTTGIAVLTAADAEAARTAIGVTTGTQISFLSYPSIDQPVTSGVWTKVTLGTVPNNTGGKFASSRFSPGIEGTYQLNGAVYGYSASLPAGGVVAAIYKNGVPYLAGASGTTGTSQVVNISIPVYLSATDYVELWANVAGSSPVVKAGSLHETIFGGFLAAGGAPGPTGPQGPVSNAQLLSTMYGGF